MTIGTSSAGNNPACSRGFTLLELLIVLALLGLMLALVPPAFSGRVLALNTRASALDLAAALRQVRGLAIRDNRVTRLQLTAVPPAYRSLPDGAEKPLSPELQIGVRSDDSEAWLAPDVVPAVFHFYPDGSSSGGEIRLSDQSQSFVLSLDWMLGRVAVQRDDGES